jgi:Fe-S oxidoreductase
MEIDPGYCDVTIARFEAMTGQPAILDGEDRTFADIAAVRREKLSA